MLTNIVQYDAEDGHTPQEKELSKLLSKPHIAAILTAHDKIANKDYPLRSVAESGLGIGAKEGEDVKGFPNPVRVVHMEKKDKPLVRGFLYFDKSPEDSWSIMKGISECISKSES